MWEKRLMPIETTQTVLLLQRMSLLLLLSWVLPAAPAGADLATTPIEEHFEAGLPAGWSASGDWEVGLPTGTGPAAPFDGAAAATKISGSYSDGVSSTLTTPVLDFTGVTDATLRFVHYFESESGFDGGHLAISFDGGSGFAVIPDSSFQQGAPYSGTLGGSSALAGQVAWSGAVTGDWEALVVDLEAVLGANPRTQVVIAFRFASDDSVPYPGWYLDTVQIGDASAFDPPAVPIPPWAPFCLAPALLLAARRRLGSG